MKMLRLHVVPLSFVILLVVIGCGVPSTVSVTPDALQPTAASTRTLGHSPTATSIASATVLAYSPTVTVTFVPTAQPSLIVAPISTSSATDIPTATPSATATPAQAASCAGVQSIDPASPQAQPIIDAVAPDKVVPGDTYGATFRRLVFAYQLNGWVTLLAQYDGEEDLYALLQAEGAGFRFVTHIPVVEASDAERLQFLRKKAPDAPVGVLRCLLVQPWPSR